jgi:hypothetical protein
MKIRDSHYSNFTVPPVGSTLMISDLNVYGGELATVVENQDKLLVKIDSTGELVELVSRNHFNVINAGDSNESDRRG